MQTILEQPLSMCPYLELRTAPGKEGVPLHGERITDDLPDLIEETYIRGLLSEQLPLEHDAVRVALRPVFAEGPLVQHFEVRVTALRGTDEASYTLEFNAGRWVRRSQLRLQQLREEGSLAEGKPVYRAVVCLQNGTPPELKLPLLQPPAVEDQSLEAFGVRRLGEGSLVPDRPILVNQRSVAEILRMTEDSGPTEIGGAMLGKHIRLPEPLPGTQTRIVTLLTTHVVDTRHSAPTTFSFAFSPEALAEAAQIAQMRGLGESVLTVFHSHGWANQCGNCNQNEKCLLPECTLVSLDDYQVLESLLPGKSTIMPIAGRKLGAEGRHPVLEIHAWRGGQMRPVRWQGYED
jgi:hypothetical protein